MRVLLVTMYFPPAGGGGVGRPLKLATHLPELGIETHVLAPDDPKWLYRDDELAVPPDARVHRVRYVGPSGRLPREELHGLEGFDRVRTIESTGHAAVRHLLRQAAGLESTEDGVSYRHCIEEACQRAEQQGTLSDTLREMFQVASSTAERSQGRFGLA